MEKLNRADVLNLICQASIMDNLGMIIGAGFTKALTNNKTLDWAGLLKFLCRKTHVEYDKLEGSKPEIASQICRKNAENKGCLYSESVAEVKTLAVQALDVTPSNDNIQSFKKFFDTIQSNWIVTTNYDLNLEAILSGKSISIDPTSCFFKVKGITPIYHIHGISNDPKNIVLTNEDYVSLFRPSDYRQSRLPFLIKESTVLMLGYSLNDFNVISSLDLANNVYKNINNNYDSSIIKVIRNENYNPEPYQNDDGIIIIETDELINFFDELIAVYQGKAVDIQNKNEEVMDKINFFQNATQENFDDFIDNPENRKEIISFVASLNLEYQYIYPSYIRFLEQVDDVLYERARPNGAFSAYDEKLKVILDILKNVNFNKTPYIFVRFIFSRLLSLSPSIGTNLGQSYAAANTWNTEAPSLPREVLCELKKYAGTTRNNMWLNELLAQLDIG